MTDYRRLFDLTAKRAVVLGAASGIGKSSAEALAGLGATVVCADRDGGGVEATAAGIRERGGAAETIVTDAASAAAVRGLADQVKALRPRIDIAVTTPGLNIRKTILDYTEEDLDRVVTLNLKGTVFFFQAFGRIMMEQGGAASSPVPRCARSRSSRALRSTAAPRRRSGYWSSACVGGRPLRRPRQCDRAEHRRDGHDRTVQAAP
jgi:NAD(P)-dependent dehydrogenase (short-subunit alcohol dehydrogenase family)